MVSPAIARKDTTVLSSSSRDGEIEAAIRIEINPLLENRAAIIAVVVHGWMGTMVPSALIP
jgi:hypothetical protein